MKCPDPNLGECGHNCAGKCARMVKDPAQSHYMDPRLPANAGIPTHVEIPMPAQAVRELATLAIDIALGCPLDRPSQPGYYTYVNRDTVREIRRVLEAAGVPWKLQHKELRK